MNAQKILTLVGIVSLFSVIATLSAVKANAGEICYTQYGGGETCIETDDNSTLDVNKKVWNPVTEDYQDHINPSDGSNPYTFKPSEYIKFQIEVKNTGEVKIENINLEDILPQFLKYSDGDGDGSDDGTKVDFEEFDLEPGESETFEFTAKIASDGILPEDDMICLTNVAEAEGDVVDSDDTESDVDYSNFCIDLPSKESPEKLPTTGGLNKEQSGIFLLTSISAGLLLVGLGLKKLAMTF